MLVGVSGNYVVDITKSRRIEISKKRRGEK